MEKLLLEVLISAVLACLMHEAGHYFTALCFGERIVFRFAWGKLWGKVSIPRGVWYMPEGFSVRHKKITAVAGFGAEFLAAPIFYAVGLWAYIIVALLHLILYRFYAGEASDFKWL
ncbi:hypothetical protein [Cloacibacillus sp.]|uniref:hypothetical protein n=1 Tax=Cloacibacillus sp. TaxID=2049023 RepID=UPI0025C05509|nr:hypothetical protein [Cloacibacillus sp.]MCC8056449.1 hypothetical protein [Cloacibacillus sp.]